MGPIGKGLKRIWCFGSSFVFGVSCFGYVALG